MWRCFNSRPHEEVDGRLRWPFSVSVHVSTHDLTKRSTADRIAPSGSYTFQLTTSRRGRRTILKQNLQRQNSFNSRPHEEVDPLAFLTPDIVQPFQLTTSRRGRQLCRLLEPRAYHLFQLTTSRRGRQQFLRKKFSFQNHFLCSLHIIYSYYINTIFFSTLFLAKSSFFLVRIL